MSSGPSFASIVTCSHIVRDVYVLRSRWKDSKRFLDILTYFAQNLDASIVRLKAREAKIGEGRTSVALESISKDFDVARNWLATNEENLKSTWSASEAADRLKDLDNRLSKSFASKMVISLFEISHDSRLHNHRIRQAIDNLDADISVLPKAIDDIVKQTSSQQLQEIIAMLHEEHKTARPQVATSFPQNIDSQPWSLDMPSQSSYFRNGMVLSEGQPTATASHFKGTFASPEYDKVISSMIDQVNASQHQKEEDSLRGQFSNMNINVPVINSLSYHHSHGPIPSQLSYQSRSATVHMSPPNTGRHLPPHPQHPLHANSYSVKPQRSMIDQRLSINTSQVFPLRSPSSSSPHLSARSATRAVSNGYFPGDRVDQRTSTSPTIRKSPSMHNIQSYDKGKGRAPEIQHLNVNIPPTHTWSGAVPGGMIGFNAVDPVTKFEIVDPVLGSDGLIRDRWAIMINPHQPNSRDPTETLRIVGDVVQLREAIFKTFPERQVECEIRRGGYRDRALDLIAHKGHLYLREILTHLDNILLWEPTSVRLLLHRAITRFRLRELDGCSADLNKVIELTRSNSSLPPAPGYFDALRFRALLKEEIRDLAGAEKDVNEILNHGPNDDLLAISLSASFKANGGDFDGAEADLEKSKAIESKEMARASEFQLQNRDLAYLARGWAWSSVGNFAAAIDDFGLSLSLRPTPEPYTLSSRGLALVNAGQVEEGMTDIEAAIKEVSEFELKQSESAERRLLPGYKEDKIPIHAYGCFYLRGMARYSRGDFKRALDDVEMAVKLRPSIVKDTGEFRYVLACLRAETGDYAASTRDFDMAMALKPEERESYMAARIQYGV